MIFGRIKPNSFRHHEHDLIPTNHNRTGIRRYRAVYLPPIISIRRYTYATMTIHVLGKMYSQYYTYIY